MLMSVPRKQNKIAYYFAFFATIKIKFTDITPFSVILLKMSFQNVCQVIR